MSELLGSVFTWAKIHFVQPSSSNMIKLYKHIPVLLKEVLEYLDPKPNENFVDATLGGGGYSSAILERVMPDGKVLAIDADFDAIENFKSQILKSKYQKNAVVAHGNFRDIDGFVERHKFTPISGIVADLGLSSYQLDQAGRGLTFQKDELLDMRFNTKDTQDDARFIINNKTVEELAEIFKKYGEEKFALRIAKKIGTERNKKPISHTLELFEIISQALPGNVRHRAADSVRRIFQALRIAVNYELDSLEAFLPKAFDLLAPGGRLVIVSFHSLEDRIVKQFFLGLNKGCVCPPDFPLCVCGKNPRGKILTKKPVIAAEKEQQANSRSKPAKLRAIIKL